jgi:hypothetical protein
MSRDDGTKPAAEVAADKTDSQSANTGSSGPGGKSKPGGKDDLKSIPMADVFAKLGSTKDGLTSAEAAKRLAQYGPNAIAEKTENPFLKFLTYFWGPIPWMIEAAVVLSGIVRHWLDFGVILLLLCTNAVVGFWEEHQAGNAIAALKKQLAVDARVLRDGKWTNPKVAELVRATSFACAWATSSRPTRGFQTLMYLMLSVAGHLTIFITRTRGPWWSIRPARILLFAVLGTQTFATLMAV